MDSVKSKKAKTPVVQKTPKSAKKNDTPVVQKTPKSAQKNDKSVNKTPLPKNDTPRPPKKQNGVQTPNKKGNATPKKTPKTDPKKKKTPPKKVEESENDDEEEEDDSEIELNPELMKKLSEMQDDDDDDEDMENDDDDDDDEAEDDDDDDDQEDEEGDDDDDDDEESELDEDELKVLIQSLKGKKSKKEAATESAKGAKKTEKPEAKKPAPKEFPKPKQPKEADKTEPAVQVDKSDYLKSIKERDCRTLFMKGLPIDIKEETIMKLSKDIQSVRIRKRARKDERRTLCYAFVEFVNEAMAEKNFKILSETKIDGKTVMVDYTGDKSLARPTKERVIKELDPSKLYITGFPYSTTELELKQLMPKAETVTLPIKRAENRPLGFAFAKFADPEVCSQELKRLNGKTFKDCTLVVLHANLTRKPKEPTKRKATDDKGKAKKIKLDKSKKAKKEEKMEEEEDDDDDEEDDDDDDEDDEEDDDSDEE